MKHIKGFREHMNTRSFVLENALVKLAPGEQESFMYILGTSGEDENETINEAIGSSIINRLKTIAKKGALTAALLTSLMSTPAFANEYNQLTSTEKTEVQQMVSADSTAKKTVSSENSLIINIGSSFKSGEHKIINVKDSALMVELSKLNEYINKSSEQNFKITITASESQVPNKDAATGDRLEVGALSKMRAESAEALVQNYINSLGINAGVVIEKATKVGTEKWNNDDAHSDKYTKDQYVNIKIEVNQCPLCNFEREYQGNVAGAEVDYVGYSKEFDVAGQIGSGSVKVSTGTIPDRVVMIGDGEIIGDSGYVADAVHQYKEWLLIPSYVSGLTKVLIETPGAKAIAGIESIDVNSFEELMGILLKPEFNNPSKYNPSKDLQKEIAGGIKELKAMYDGGQRKFILYKEGKINIKYDLQKKYKDVKVVIYSPIGKTGFKMNISCSGK